MQAPDRNPTQGAGRRRRLQDLTPAEIAPLEALFEPGYPERSRDLALVFFAELLNHGVADAHQVAYHLAEAVREELGGQKYYWTMGKHFEADKRARRILQEYDGTNLGQLARKHRLSHERVRSIVAPLKAEREARAREIGAAFDGRNAKALARRHGLEPGDVLRLVREDPAAREAHFMARQGSLPLEGA